MGSAFIGTSYFNGLTVWSTNGALIASDALVGARLDPDAPDPRTDVREPAGVLLLGAGLGMLIVAPRRKGA